MCGLKIFSPVCNLSFHPLYMDTFFFPFSEEVLNFNKVDFSVFPIVHLDYCSYIRNLEIGQTDSTHIYSSY